MISSIPIVKKVYIISLQYIVPPGCLCRGPNLLFVPNYMKTYNY